METKIGIVVGSKSDLPLIKKCENVLDLYGIKYELKVLSAHRTPDETAEYTRNAKKSGIDLIIAGAGMAAHLAGAIASQTTLPVIGIPIKSGDLGGLDSLLSTVQMPAGIPVATVAVNGAENAAHLAAQILALKYPKIEQKITEIRKDMKKEVLSN
ncbi:MAG: 5-(carboxyamino)imidazole ribonucleotide mutase [Candidatus Anammoxibacter sp.]